MSAPSNLLVLRRPTVVIALVASILGVLPAPDAGAAPPETLSPAGQNAADPQVAVDADGDAVIVWQRFDGTNWRIQARRRSKTGALSAVQTLSAAGQSANDPQVAVDQDGDAVIVWEGFDGTNSRIQARRRSAAGALSPVRTLSAAGQNAFDPQVAVDADGDAVIVWEGFDGTNYRIRARRRSAAGALSPVQTLSAAGRSAFSPQVAVGQDGHALVVWERSDGTNWQIQARRRSAAGALSPVQTLSPAGHDAHVPQVAVDPDGHGVIAWELRAGTNWRIQARRRSAEGALSPVQTLSPAGQGAADPQVAVDADGDAVIVWERFDLTNDRIQARRRSAGGALSPVQTLSAAGESAEAPQVAVDQEGQAVVVWQRSDGTNQRIQSVGL
ncbi:MAG: hypothetical protein M3245_05725 [Actinomycetota bacterium]|nr:hypothetical protein [Actinomycetota bacterium]